MGRNSTGAVTTAEVCKLELKLLLRDKMLQKDCHYAGSLTWTNGSSCTFESKYDKEEKYVRLKYTLTEFGSGKKLEYDYKIQLTTLPSNLGKGEVLYFLCPQTRTPCRVLYRAYGSHIYTSRQAYPNRIYYPLQVSSKRSIYNDRYWRLENILQPLYKMRDTGTYKGKRTKRFVRISILREKQRMADLYRWSPAAMPVSLRKFIFKYS